MKIKWLLIVLMTVTTIIMSCDRRTSKKDRLEQDVLEFNKKIKLIDVKHFYPESYVEIKTDSIISNTFRVSIKNHSIDNASIFIDKSVKDLKSISKYHRVFESDVLVSVNDKIVFSEHISAANFKDKNPSVFWKNATLEHVWVNQDISNQNMLSLGISFVNPKQNTYHLYEMRIDTQGNERLIFIEHNS